MSIRLIDVLFILMLFVIFWNGKIIWSVKELNKDYLSIENVNALRGIMALGPVFMHVSNAVTCSKGILWWSTYGASVVAIFFFLSGFGLMKQHMTHDDYAKKFLTRRLPKIIIPYVIATGIYWIADFYFLGFLYPIKGIFNAIWQGVPIVTYSWYVIHLSLFYLFFYALMKVFGKHYLGIAFGGVIYYIVTSLYFYSRGFGTQWYQTSLAIPVGLFWALYEKKIYSIMAKYYWVGLALLGILIVYIYNSKSFMALSSNTLVKNTILLILFCVLVIVMLMKIELGNPINKFLGYISYEVYLFHGLFMMAFRGDKFYIANDNMYVMLVFTGTLVLAVITKQCSQYIFKLLYKK